MLAFESKFAGSSFTPVTADLPQVARRWGGFIGSIWRWQIVRVALVSPVLDAERWTHNRNRRRLWRSAKYAVSGAVV